MGRPFEVWITQDERHIQVQLDGPRVQLTLPVKDAERLGRELTQAVREAAKSRRAVG
jgi:hypothetical protein